MNKSAARAFITLAGIGSAFFINAPALADVLNVGGSYYKVLILPSAPFKDNQAKIESSPWFNGDALGFARAWGTRGGNPVFVSDVYSLSNFPDLVVGLIPITDGRLGSFREFLPATGTYAIGFPLPSKTSSTKTSGGKTVVNVSSGVSPNTGTAAGGYLSYLQNSNSSNTGTYSDLLVVLASLSSISDVDSAYEQLTAEPYASNLSVGLESMNRFRKNALAIALADNKISYTKTERVKVCQDENGQSSTTALNPGQKLSKDETNCAITKVKTTLPWSLVIDGTNTQASLRGTEDLGSLDYNIFQSTYGVEYALNNQFSIGGVFGYGQNNLYNYEFADTRVNSDTYSGGLYGLYKPSEPATIALLGGYSRFNTDSRRPIQFGTINRLAEADWNSNGYTVALTGEYAFTLNKGTESADSKQKEKESRNAILLKPNALVSFAGYSQGLIEESGAQSLNLKLNPHTATSVIFGGGLVLQAPIVVSSESRLIPRLGVGYRYDLNGNSDEEHEVTGGFVDLPEAGEIDVYGQNRGSNDVDVSLGLEYEISSNTAIYSNVAGSFWSNGNELTYGGGFRYSW